MAEELTEDIDSGLDNGKNEDTHMQHLIEALDSIISSENLDQKSDLTANNIIGMIRSLNFATECYELYKIDIRRTIINLVTEKLTKVISMNRKGRGEIIEIVRAIRAELEQTQGPMEEMGRRFIYGPK